MRAPWLGVAVGLVATLAWPAESGSAGKWSQWRGPRRDAHARGFAAPEQWPAELHEVWSLEAGAGLSSPVVAGGLVYLLTRDGDDEVVTCRKLADGGEVWSQRYPAPFFANSGAVKPRRYPVSQGRGPFATPAVDGGRLYVLGVDRTLSTFDARTGEPGWRKRLLEVEVPSDVVYVCPECGCDEDGKEFPGPGSCPACGMALNPRGLETSARRGGGNYYGAAASPLVIGDLVVVHVGNQTRGLLLAFDAATGAERWRWEGPVVAYSSPVKADLGGVPQIVVLSREALVGLAIADGERLWSFAVPNNAHLATPIVHGDLVIAAEYHGPTFAVRVSRDGDAWSAAEAWRNSTETLWLSTPLLDDGRIYGFFFSGRGHFASLDAATGKTLWSGKKRQGESATVVAAGRFLLGLKDDGTLIVFVRDGAGLRRVREHSVADLPTWTYPALAGDGILIKDESRLTLWRVE